MIVRIRLKIRLPILKGCFAEKKSPSFVDPTKVLEIRYAKPYSVDILGARIHLKLQNVMLFSGPKRKAGRKRGILSCKVEIV